MTTTTVDPVSMPTSWPDRSVGRVVSDDGYRIASRVIFPVGGDLDVLPLYIDRLTTDTTQMHPEDVLSRYSVRVLAGERLSMGSYFNAFPASY